MADHSEHHVVPVKVYIGVFLALMVFTALTVYVARFDLEHDWGWSGWNIIIAMTVAVIKATLVVLYFMHVRYSSRLTQVIVVSGVFWLIIMLALTISDYATRTGWPR